MDERECEVIESEDVISDTSNHGAVTVDEVIDGMGFGRYQVWLLSLCGAGWAADILDLQVIAYLIPALVKAFLHLFGHVIRLALLGHH